jgi:hypothetical protein
MSKTAFAMNNFISLQQLTTFVNKSIETVEADVEEFGIPLYRIEGEYGLTIEDMEGYIANLFEIEKKKLLERIYLNQSEEYVPCTVLDIVDAPIPAIPSIVLKADFDISMKVRKTDTKECLRSVLQSLGDYKGYLKMLITKEDGYHQFVDRLATKLKHHKSKTINSKVDEINKAILELWTELKP